MESGTGDGLASTPGSIPEGWVGPHKPDSVSLPKRGRDHLSDGGLRLRPPASGNATITRGFHRRNAEGFQRIRPGGPSPLFCLAPRGVCLASFIAVGAVGSYPAFSPLPPKARGQEGRFVSVTLSMTSGYPEASDACARHAALWCPDFPLGGRTHQAATPADPVQHYSHRCPAATANHHRRRVAGKLSLTPPLACLATTSAICPPHSRQSFRK